MYTAKLGELYGIACLLRLAAGNAFASVQVGSGHCVVASSAQAGNVFNSEGELFSLLSPSGGHGVLLPKAFFFFLSSSSFCRRYMRKHLTMGKPLDAFCEFLG